MSLISLFAVVLSFARIIVGDFLFIFPTEPGPNADFAADLSFTLGSTQKIEWNTTLESYHIDLYQQIISGDATQQLMTIYSVSGGAGQKSFDWQVAVDGSSLSFSPVYFLWAFSPGDPTSFTSHYFNITNRAQSSSSSSLSSSSSSSSSPSSSSPSSSRSLTAFTSSTSSTNSVIRSSTSSSQSQKSSDATPTSPASASSSMMTVKVGLGVGLGIGIPLVLIAGIWIGLKLVEQRQSSSRGTSSDVPRAQFPNNKYPPDSYFPPSASEYDRDRFHEASGGNRERYELTGERELTELGS